MTSEPPTYLSYKQKCSSRRAALRSVAFNLLLAQALLNFELCTFLFYNNNNNTTSSDIKIEAPGTYPTGFENVVYKNARCSGYWKVDLVNRNNKLVYYKAAFFTVDQDGDPLKTQLLGLNGWLKLFQSSRSTIDLDIFDCSINFEELQASFEIYSP